MARFSHLAPHGNAFENGGEYITKFETRWLKITGSKVSDKLKHISNNLIILSIELHYAPDLWYRLHFLLSVNCLSFPRFNINLNFRCHEVKPGEISQKQNETWRTFAGTQKQRMLIIFIFEAMNLMANLLNDSTKKYRESLVVPGIEAVICRVNWCPSVTRKYFPVRPYAW